MENRIKGIVIAMFVMLSTSAVAQNYREYRQNNYQINQGYNMLQQDIDELESVKRDIIRLERALNRHNIHKVNSLQRDIIRDFHREVEQSGYKIELAKREVAESREEVRSERHESRRNPYDQRSRRDSREDLEDDRRDLRDDKRDLERQIERFRKQKDILRDLKHFNFHANGHEAVVIQINMMYDFMRIMEADIAATKRELREDHRESREDMAERHEDRRYNHGPRY